MKVLKEISGLESLLKSTGQVPGCLADTGFLYAWAYDDDRIFNRANDVIDVLADFNVPIYANVISRVEFIDLIFRKQVTIGSIQLYERIDSTTKNKILLNLLKNIRDQDTANRRQHQSFKVDEKRLKALRKEIKNVVGSNGWKQFCNDYVGEMLFNEWSMLEDDLDLRFVEILEGQISELFNEPLLWSDMVRIMGTQGIRSPDAMILNLFEKSKFPLLITSDSDFLTYFDDKPEVSKSVFLLEN